MLFIQYFDEQKNERCGSDYVWVPDQRKSVRTMCISAHDNPNQKVYKNGEKKLAYFRIVRGRISDRKYNYVTDFIRV